LSCAFPKTHIVIVGIEKMIPSLTDLGLFWPLLSTFGTGQKVTVYNTIITGPRQPNETDGPDEMYVILLDNGRTNILQNPKTRESLYCIRCGACLNACPIYKNIGGHAYGATYSGPIGSVITPHLQGMQDFKHLENRKESVEEGLVTFSEKMAWKVWKIASLKRGLMNMGNGNLKNKVVNGLFKGWKEHRSDLEFSNKTFNEMWKERYKK